jgi:choline dehydrogenase-like flavoprotein
VSALVHIDGREVTRTLRMATDVVVVGSGPAGAAVARRLAARGARVVVLEEGHHVTPSQFEASGLRAMASLYRDMGTSIAFGTNPMPYLQGRSVGGTSVVNGAISWQFPRDSHEAWCAEDPALRDAIPFEDLAREEAAIETRLGVHPTEARVAGPKNVAMARGADALGLANRPIRRNTEGCVGAGRCLQGCPHGAKLSMERTFLPDAVRDGGRIVSGVTVSHVLLDARGAYGVRGLSARGSDVEVRARHAVVIAASAIQSPLLLRGSGLKRGPVGDRFSAHPGVSVTGRFAQSVRGFVGATQGAEVTGLRHEGLKLEALGFDLGILASRIPGVGTDLARRLAELDHYAVFGAAIRAEAEGTVRSGPLRPSVRYSLTHEDMKKARRAVRRLGEVLLAAGAQEVYPGVAGFDPVVRDPRRMAAIDEEGPLDPKAYPMSMTHLFGTARMGTDPATSVVRPDFRHHDVAGLYVADSSVFPSNLGVNPQIPIMTLATLCADRILI